MKCVCPMGGDRTCPDDCPLAVWASLSPSDRKAQRRTIAERLFREGFTQEAIATQLGVSHQTIGRDLDQLSTMDNTPRTSSRGHPRGGRPRNRTRPTERANPPAAREAMARAVLDEGQTVERVASDHRVTRHVVRTATERELGRREAQAEPEIDRAALSMSAQQKLDAAIRQEKRKLAAEFEQLVQAKVTEIINEGVLPSWKRRLEEAETVLRRNRRRGAMTMAEFRNILSCLHTDRFSQLFPGMEIDPSLRRRFDRAFQEFKRVKVFLVSEEESPTESLASTVPRTRAEWDAARERVRQRNSERARTASRRSGSAVARP